MNGGDGGKWWVAEMHGGDGGKWWVADAKGLRQRQVVCAIATSCVCGGGLRQMVGARGKRRASDASGGRWKHVADFGGERQALEAIGGGWMRVTGVGAELWPL